MTYKDPKYKIHHLSLFIGQLSRVQSAKLAHIRRKSIWKLLGRHFESLNFILHIIFLFFLIKGKKVSFSLL